jgi:dolichol-phosphate mannosyltransferase
MKASLVIPTYNESENIYSVVDKVFAISGKNSLDLHIVIVDDNSPDGTGELAENLAKIYPGKMTVLHRCGKEGLSSAIVAGFNASQCDVVGVTDADISHDIEKIPDLLYPIMSGSANITIGSRHVPGGEVIGWPLSRRLISEIAILLARPLTRVRDPVSGFFFMDKTITKDVVLNSEGYKILLEILVKGRSPKWVEVPYTFMNRKNGKSKFDFNEVCNYLKTLLRLYIYRLKA